MSDTIESIMVHFTLSSSIYPAKRRKKYEYAILLHCIIGYDLPSRVSGLFQSQLRWILYANRVALLGFSPVDDLPDALDITGLVVEILNESASVKGET